jgi:hypothetical protein
MGLDVTRPFIGERAVQRSPNLTPLFQPIQVLFKPLLFGHPPYCLTHDKTLVTRPGCGESLQELRRLFVDRYLHLSHPCAP